jgi:Trypsin-like peptidase domain
MNRKQRRAAKSHHSKLDSTKLRAMNISDKGLRYTIRTRDGLPFWDAAVIFPIFGGYEPVKPKLFGIGFYITRFGHFLTAQHVLMELHKIGTTGFMVHMLDDDKSAIVRNITVFSYHPTADVALGALEHPPGYVFNRVPRLTTECPKIGEPIVTIAYDKETGTRSSDDELLISPKYMSGMFEEVHLQGRDAVMLPFPCYRSSISIPGGASGGPVFDSKGRVFGINSTGYDGTEVSYLARVEEILPLTAHGMMFGPNEQPTDRTLLELAQSGHVVFTPKIGAR